MRRNSARRMLATGIVVTLAMLVNGTAGASPVVHTSVVSTDPADFTPRVVTGTAVYKLLQVGTTMFAGGDFTEVRNAVGSTVYARSNLFSFDAAAGAVTSLTVSFDRPVWAMASDGASLWVGGNFRTVNGVARRGLVKLDPTTGEVDPRFNARLRGNVSDVQLVDGRLIVAGKFAKRLQAVDPATGADTGYLDLGISGTVASNAGATDVYRFAVDHAVNATRLVAIGNFTTVGAATRHRAFMLDLGPTGTLASWYYPSLERACRATRQPAQLRDVDFSPAGDYFVFVATGFLPQAGDQGVTICDATARFSTTLANPALPDWINYTGGDTLHSVVVTDAAVYIQGHQRWVSSTGSGCTPGCAPREGIAALAPADGAALAWNPGKSRGVGGKDLLLTPAGLWVGSDTNLIGGETHQKLAFLPR